jgi:hypothetical protein
VWHASSEPFVRDGKLHVAGIVQEQHPDRARLFMQWRQMDWPIMVDPLNLLGVAAVPITLLIDEHGIVRSINPKPNDLVSFVGTIYEPSDPSPQPVPVEAVPIPAAPADLTVEGWRSFGDQLVLWGGSQRFDAAVDAYTKALVMATDPAIVHFRLGVAYRARYDSAQAQSGDFARAVEHWGRALALDPNQYIWRRRIPQ